MRASAYLRPGSRGRMSPSRLREPVVWRPTQHGFTQIESRVSTEHSPLLGPKAPTAQATVSQDTGPVSLETGNPVPRTVDTVCRGRCLPTQVVYRTAHAERSGNPEDACRGAHSLGRTSHRAEPTGYARLRRTDGARVCLSLHGMRIQVHDPKARRLVTGASPLQGGFQDRK